MKSLFFILFIPVTISVFSQTPSFPPINYISDKFQIPQDSFPLLNRIIDLLKKDTTLIIEVSGHTDNMGNEPFNQNLSKRRANVIAAYFIQSGIDSFRVKTIGYGSRKHVMSNDFSIGQERNRRVEFAFLKGKFKRVSFSGTMLDEETKKPIAAEITIEDRKTGEEIAKGKSDEKTGVFEISAWLKKSELYDLTFSADDYFFDIQTINADSIEKIKPEKRFFKLPKIKIGRSYKFKNMNFYGDEARMLPESLPALKSLYKMMMKNEKLKILIEGHTNGIGDDNPTRPWHLELSNARAKTVFDYLVAKGIDSARIKKIGYGCKFMITNNPLEQGKNMRVEIKVLEK